MMMQSKRAGSFLTFAGCLAASLPVWSESCTGPASIETQLRTRPNAVSYAALGKWFDAHRRTDCALEAYQSALKLEPDSKTALDGLAKALIAAGDYETAIRRLRSASSDENLILDLAVAYRKSQRFDEATQTLVNGLKTFPNSVSLTGALVSLYVHESHFAAASKLAGELTQVKPRDLEAQRIYLRTLVITGENDTAIPLARKMLVLAPHDADLLNLIGFLERKSGHYPAARKHLEESVALNPSDYNSRVNLGLVLGQLDDAAGAKLQLEKAVELGATEAQVRFELAKVLRTLGENDEAQKQLKLYQQKLKEEADQSLAVLKATQAEEAAKDGDNQKAANLYREACAAQPNDAGLAYRLSVALANLGDAVGQRAALENAIRADPNSVQAHYALGYLHFQAGNNAAAEEQFRLVVKAAPENARAWISLAATLGTDLQFQEGLDAVAHALNLEPNNAAALELSKKLTAALERH
jgi:Flp pilus assembly protein TadD